MMTALFNDFLSLAGEEPNLKNPYEKKVTSTHIVTVDFLVILLSRIPRLSYRTSQMHSNQFQKGPCPLIIELPRSLSADNSARQLFSI